MSISNKGYCNWKDSPHFEHQILQADVLEVQFELVSHKEALKKAYTPLLMDIYKELQPTTLTQYCARKGEEKATEYVQKRLYRYPQFLQDLKSLGIEGYTKLHIVAAMTLDVGIRTEASWYDKLKRNHSTH